MVMQDVGFAVLADKQTAQVLEPGKDDSQCVAHPHRRASVCVRIQRRQCLVQIHTQTLTCKLQ